MKLLSLLKSPRRLREIIRCTLPTGIPTKERAALLLDLLKLAYRVNTAELTRVEISYGPGEDKALWVFELDHTANFSLTDGQTLWVPDNQKKLLIPFHTDLIGEVYITTLGSTA